MQSRYFILKIGCQITLSDGRKLGYASYCYGTPQRTILVFPGLPGSRLFNFNNWARPSWNCQMYVLERPGLGISSYRAHKSFVNWADDVKEFMDQLQIYRTSIIGYSAGGPYALAVCHKLSHKIDRAAIISSISPRKGLRNQYDLMPFNFKLAWFCAEYLPIAISWATASEQRDILIDAVKSHHDSVSIFAQCDHQMLLSPAVEQLFCESGMELASRNQSDAIAYEYSLYGKPWGFELNGIPPHLVGIWHGTLDAGTTIAMGKLLADSIGCESHFIEGKGHMLIFEIIDDVVEWINQA